MGAEGLDTSYLPGNGVANSGQPLSAVQEGSEPERVNYSSLTRIDEKSLRANARYYRFVGRNLSRVRAWQILNPQLKQLVEL